MCKFDNTGPKCWYPIGLLGKPAANPNAGYFIVAKFDEQDFYSNICMAKSDIIKQTIKLLDY